MFRDSPRRAMGFPGAGVRSNWSWRMLLAAAGNPSITEQLLSDVKLGDRIQEPSRRLQPRGIVPPSDSKTICPSPRRTPSWMP